MHCLRRWGRLSNYRNPSTIRIPQSHHTAPAHPFKIFFTRWMEEFLGHIIIIPFPHLKTISQPQKVQYATIKRNKSPHKQH